MARKKPEGALATVSSTGGYVDPQKVYDDWSRTYDADLLDEYGYVAPQIAADEFVRQVPDKSATLIDMGCGTGLAGAELRKRGYSRIDGADISSGMLSQARQLGIYRQLFKADLTRRFALPDASYDAVISVGAFGNGHLKADALPGFVRLVRPGGHVVVYLNAVPFLAEGYERSLREFEQAGALRVHSIEASNYMDALDRPGRLLVVSRAG
ncbi:MAG: class I SAM-dependent methyltransferase [Pseudomonadota bacterium]